MVLKKNRHKHVSIARNIHAVFDERVECGKNLKIGNDLMRETKIATLLCYSRAEPETTSLLLKKQRQKLRTGFLHCHVTTLIDIPII